LSDTVDLEKLCILLERRFRVLQDVKKISDEMGDCISRRDGVSTEIEMNMRLEALKQCDALWMEIQEMGEAGPESAATIHRLVNTDPWRVEPQDGLERKALEIRKKTIPLIETIQRENDVLQRRLEANRSQTIA
jgi:hypothetical protein